MHGGTASLPHGETGYLTFGRARGYLLGSWWMMILSRWAGQRLSPMRFFAPRRSTAVDQVTYFIDEVEIFSFAPSSDAENPNDF